MLHHHNQFFFYAKGLMFAATGNKTEFLELVVIDNVVSHNREVG